MNRKSKALQVENNTYNHNKKIFHSICFNEERKMEQGNASFVDRKLGGTFYRHDLKYKFFTTILNAVTLNKNNIKPLFLFMKDFV